MPERDSRPSVDAVDAVDSATRRTGAVDAEIAPGVREIEHTADLGMTVRADTLEELFRRAATGMMQLMRADSEEAPAVRMNPEAAGDAARPDPESATRSIELEPPGDDVADLFVRWLRELLYVQEVDGFVYGDAEFERLDASGLAATVTPRSHATTPIRELKGVTYHGLDVGRDEAGGWRARVIFDI